MAPDADLVRPEAIAVLNIQVWSRILATLPSCLPLRFRSLTAACFVFSKNRTKLRCEFQWFLGTQHQLRRLLFRTHPYLSPCPLIVFFLILWPASRPLHTLPVFRIRKPSPTAPTRIASLAFDLVPNSFKGSFPNRDECASLASPSRQFMGDGLLAEDLLPHLGGLEPCACASRAMHPIRGKFAAQLIGYCRDKERGRMRPEFEPRRFVVPGRAANRAWM